MSEALRPEEVDKAFRSLDEVISNVPETEDPEVVLKYLGYTPESFYEDKDFLDTLAETEREELFSALELMIEKPKIFQMENADTIDVQLPASSGGALSSAYPSEIEDKERVTFVDLGMALYERLTGRNATISYEFDNITVETPHRIGPETSKSAWKVNGTLRITTSEPEQ